MNELITTPNNLPTAHPAEVIDISPEALEIANCYLQHQDIRKVADELSVPLEVVTRLLDKREVKAYIDHVFMNLGFNNRFRMRKAMDAILEKKFRDMDEAGLGSGKDIVEIMTLSHKMAMDELDRQIKLRELEIKSSSGPKSQVNVQINNEGGSNYNSLIDRLMKVNNA